MTRIDLSTFNNDFYHPGKGILVRSVWFILNAVFMQSPLNPWSSLKVFLLRSFGARIGQGVVIKPSVNIKYPWRLSIGDHVWIGEKVWIDNLGDVSIGSHSCLSQGAMLLSGNHNYKDPAFGLMVQPIVLEEAVWMGAKSMVTQGVTCGEGAVLATQSVASKNLEAFTIYRGNPATAIKKRTLS